ncbi:hypothetical protein B0H13DRAFT_2507249 [Mycena leptocephala]|nr:hypothetical protein B0H13DRAFT_2507249 [Mycena leptocephala]
MPKVDANITAETSLTVTTQQDMKKMTTELLIGDRGHKLQELEIKFSTADHNDESKREFNHHATTAARTDFTLYSVMKLVSSWPNLRVIDAIFELVLPAIESIRIGGCNHPTAAFIRDKLSAAPNLESIHFGGDTDDRGIIRKAFADALDNSAGDDEAEATKPKPFPALRRLAYPAQDGTYNTGRGRNARQNEYENVGESALLKACSHRGIYASRASNIEYKVEGSQRRACLRSARIGRFKCYKYYSDARMETIFWREFAGMWSLALSNFDISATRVASQGF